MLNVCRDKMLFGLDKGRCCEGLFPDISVALETPHSSQQYGVPIRCAHISRLPTTRMRADSCEILEHVSMAREFIGEFGH
jgi:hypothetical protein